MCLYCSKKGGKKGGKKEKPKSSWVDKDYRESADLDVVCSPLTGLTCVNNKQPDNLCEDYRLRVLCGCGESLALPKSKNVPLLSATIFKIFLIAVLVSLCINKGL